MMEIKVKNADIFGTNCPHCKGQRKIVRSRAGGFVSQDCTKCGRSGYLPFVDLPILNCKKCGSRLEKYISVFKNYCYECKQCETAFELASIVPNWEEHFDYDGLAIDTDFIKSQF